MFDRREQHCAKRKSQAINLFSFQSESEHLGMDPCSKERLVRIDVSNASQDALVEETGLHRNTLRLQSTTQIIRTNRQGVWAELLPMSIELVLVTARNDRTETPSIPKGEGCSIAQGPANMHVVLLRREGFTRQDLSTHAKTNNQQASSARHNRQLFAFAKNAVNDTTIE